MKSKQKRKSQYIIALAMSGLIITGCSTDGVKEKLNGVEAQNLVMDIEKKSMADSEPFSDIEKLVVESLDKIDDKELTSSIVNSYIHALYNEASKYINCLDSLGEDLSKIKTMLKVEKIEYSIINKIPSEFKMAKGMLEEMQAKNLLIIDDKDSFYVDVDMDKIIEKFNKYLTEDIIDFMKFRQLENSSTIYNANSDDYNLKEVLKRADICIDKLFASKKDNSQLDNWKVSADYYYQIIMAEFVPAFLDEDGKVSEKYINEIKTELNNYKDTRVFKDMSKYFELLTAHERDLNADKVKEYRNQLLVGINEYGSASGKVSSEANAQEGTAG